MKPSLKISSENDAVWGSVGGGPHFGPVWVGPTRPEGDRAPKVGTGPGGRMKPSLKISSENGVIWVCYESVRLN